MDLQDFIPKSDTIVVTLYDPKTYNKKGVKPVALTNEDGTPMTMEFWAPHSETFRFINLDVIEERINAKGETPGVDEAEGDKAFKMTARDYYENALKILVKTIKSWNITFGGEQPELTEEVAEKILRVSFVKDQVDDQLMATGDFT